MVVGNKKVKRGRKAKRKSVFIPFLLLFFLIFSSFISCCNSVGDKEKKVNLSQASEVVRAIFSFTYPLVFMTYIFLKIKEFTGGCAQLKNDKLLSVNCEFDVRTLTSPGVRTEGECEIASTSPQNSQKEKISLQNCQIKVVSENFSAEIYGDVSITGLGTSFKETRISVVVPEKPIFFSVSFPEAQAEIKSLHAGESVRNFEVSGKGFIENTMKVEVDKLYVQDKGQGEIYVLPDGEVKVSGCVNKGVKITPLPGKFIFFDTLSGCPKEGGITYEGEKIYFENGKIYSDNDVFDCSSSTLECPFLIF